MSESTASRLDRVGREQRREERQRSSSAAQTSSSAVSSSSTPSLSSSEQSSASAIVTPSNDQWQDQHKDEIINDDNAISTSNLESDATTVKVVTTPNISILSFDGAGESSSTEHSNTFSEISKEDKDMNIVQSKPLHDGGKNKKELRIPKDLITDSKRMDATYYINKKEMEDISLAEGRNVATVSSSIVSEPSNFKSCNTKKALDDVISRTVDQISSIENLSGGMVVQMEACSLDEIPINQNDGANAMSRERAFEVNAWPQNELDGDLESNNTYDSHSEQHYPWRRKTIDDEMCLTANNSQYSSDAEVVISNTGRNVNMVEVNMGAGHATKTGRKVRNREFTQKENYDTANENENIAEKQIERNQRQSIEGNISNSVALHSKDRHPSLERSSSKSLASKQRVYNITTRSPHSNAPARSTSPSPSRKNTGTQKNKYSDDGDAVNSYSNSLGPTSNSAEQESANAMKQNLVQNALGLYNWQATKMTVKERLTFLFNNNILSDVTFVVGRDVHQQRIPAHRFVLSVGSAVFDAMFNRHSSKAGTSAIEEEIDLPDVEPASFLALLRFLYSDEVQIGPETVMTTLYTAKKYAVPALEKHCVDFLKRHLCADNAFMLLTQARLFDEPQLAALCLETIDKSTPEALSAEGFIDIDIDTLSAVLDRDSLRIKEAKLFSAVLKWSEAECSRQNIPSGTAENKRSVLGRVLRQIRFPLMTVEEFAQGPAQSGILTDRECVSLFLHFTVNPKPPVAFMDVPRCSMTGKEQTVCRFQQIESRWGYSGTSDKIRFIVDRRIFVVGFGLYGSIHGPSEYQVNIQIIHTGSGRLLGSNEISFSSDGTNATFRVMFKEPIEIQHNTNYTASATLKGLDSHYGTKGLRKVSVECPTGGKVTFQFSYAAGNNNGTSVEDGQIPEIIFYT